MPLAIATVHSPLGRSLNSKFPNKAENGVITLRTKRLGRVSHLPLHRMISSQAKLISVGAAVSLVAGIISMAAMNAVPLPCFAKSLENHQGGFLFQKACVGCHYQGGNVLQPSATLALKDLERNNVASEEDIFNLIYYGKGRMPGFGEKCKPKGQCTFGPRLSDHDIQVLSEFVRSQASQEHCCSTIASETSTDTEDAGETRSLEDARESGVGTGKMLQKIPSLVTASPVMMLSPPMKLRIVLLCLSVASLTWHFFQVSCDAASLCSSILKQFQGFGEMDLGSNTLLLALIFSAMVSAVAQGKGSVENLLF